MGKRTGALSSKLFAATWNVRSLVEAVGDPRICRRGTGRMSGVDRKLDFLVEEVSKCRVDVADIQETKWFGSDVWTAHGCTFLHSGRPLPAEGESWKRNEGVAILLNEKLSRMWKRGGEQWTPVSSRTVTARIQVGVAGERLARGRPRHSDFYMTIISVYAPTSKASPSVKSNFYSQLQSVIHDVDSRDLLLLLGDFNARVGSRVPMCSGNRYDTVSGEEFPWGATLGPFGLGAVNTAGEHLLSFCSSNDLSIMSTWDKKKKCRRGTWTHPATQQSHMIDFVIMSSSQRVFCHDVGVVCSATCWSDHELVRVKLSLEFVPPRSSGQKKPLVAYLLRDDACRLRFRTEMDSICGDVSGDVGECWRSLRDGVVTAAERVLGRGRRKQHDWFLESKSMLEPLIGIKRRAHDRVLACDTPVARRAWRAAQRNVAAAVRQAKEKWIASVAQEAEGAEKDGCIRWKCI